jgi:hypothetical protein
MPPVVGPVTNRLEATLEHTLEKTLETVKGKILHPSGEVKPSTPSAPSPPQPPENGQPDAGNGARQPHDEHSQRNS